MDYNSKPWDLRKRSGMTRQMLEERLLIEEDGCITWICGATLVHTEDAAIQDFVDSLSRNVALL